MVKLGVCQMAVSEKLEVNTNKIIDFIKQAATQNIDVIGFPEMALTGYTEEILRTENMNNIVSNALSEIKKTCKDVNTVAIVGHPYKKGEELYNRTSVFTWGKTYTYDKKYPTEVELKYFEKGNNSPLVFTYCGKK